MIKVVLFDLGGVVFTDFFSGGAEEFAAYLHLPSERVRDAYIETDVAGYPKGQISDEERWQSFIDKLDLPQYMLQKCIGYYYDSYRPIQETVELLQLLKASGRYRLGTLSDQPPGVMGHLYQNYPTVFELFDAPLVTISVETGLSKKDDNHAIYPYAIRKANVKPDEILFADDSRSNIAVAQTYGLQAYFFDRVGQPITMSVGGMRSLLLIDAAPASAVKTMANKSRG